MHNKYAGTLVMLHIERECCSIASGDEEERQFWSKDGVSENYTGVRFRAAQLSDTGLPVRLANHGE